ncbi:MAG: hypothetical protein MI749_14235, partial [Desulfovibrionales bacterium]|nr:hypothetical protein [Desulfovibrionales bacterium]
MQTLVDSPETASEFVAIPEGVVEVSANPIITATGVEKIYPGPVHALKNINVEILEGEVVVIVGP